MRFNRWIIGVYCGLLVLGGIYYGWAAQDAGLERVDSETVKITEQAIEQFYSRAEHGQLDQLEGALMQESWEFDVEGGPLEVIVRGNDGNLLITAMPNMQQEKLTATYFTTRMMLDSVDFTSEIKPPQVSLKDNQLIIQMPAKQHIRLAALTREFPINQFSSSDSFDRSAMSPPHKVLQLNLPMEVKLADSSYPLVQRIQPEPAS